MSLSISMPSILCTNLHRSAIPACLVPGAEGEALVINLGLPHNSFKMASEGKSASTPAPNPGQQSSAIAIHPVC